MKLTRELLKKIIEEETAKFGDPIDTETAAKKTEETDADEFADSLEKHIDYVKALKIEETRLMKRLATIAEEKKRLGKRLVSKI
jgi:hypothetical protein